MNQENKKNNVFSQSVCRDVIVFVNEEQQQQSLSGAIVVVKAKPQSLIRCLFDSFPVVTKHYVNSKEFLARKEYSPLYEEDVVLWNIDQVFSKEFFSTYTSFMTTEHLLTTLSAEYYHLIHVV